MGQGDLAREFAGEQVLAQLIEAVHHALSNAAPMVTAGLSSAVFTPGLDPQSPGDTGISYKVGTTSTIGFVSHSRCVFYPQYQGGIMSGKVAYSALAPNVLGQIINPLTYLTSSSGQYGLVNIRYGESSAPQIERAIIEDVAGYGKQLGRLLDAVEAIAQHLEKREPSIRKINAIDQLHELALAIAVKKATIADSETMPISDFIDALERLKKNNPETFEKVKEKLKAVL